MELGSRRTRLFEWCVRSSLYFIMLVEFAVVINVWQNADATTGEITASLAVTAVHVAVNVVLISWALTSLRSGHPARTLPRVRLGLVIAATVLSGLVIFSIWGPGALAVMAYVVALSWAALVPALTYRIAMIGVGFIVVLLGVATAVFADDSFSTMAGLMVGLLVMVAVITSSVWVSGWMLRVHLELDVARVDSARLAIAEERLRISRDLHDVFGRTLAAVAVKSELAAELARRGRSSEAADEISEVRTIADEAGRQVRQVLRGYREANLDVELQGARSLLDAAGIRCTVSGVPRQIGPVATSTLAWVAREAVTNLVKHSKATEVRITMTDADPVTMTITNDGVDGRRPYGQGSGLVGMVERVSESGGTLVHEVGDGTFTVRVELPREAERP